MNNDIIDIARKIEEIGKSSDYSRQKGPWKFLNDILTATIIVDTIEEVWGAYQWFSKQDQFRILTLTDNL